MNIHEDTLLQKFNGKSIIPLASCLEFLGLTSLPAANRLAAQEKLPIPTFKSRQDARAPRLVSVVHLAAYLQEQQDAAARQWQEVNVGKRFPASRAN
jgi:hypothetical protein